MRVTDRAVAADGAITTMTLPTFQAVEPPDPSDGHSEPAALRTGTLRLFDAIKGQARFLSPATQLVFFASCLLLVLVLPVLVAVGMLGAPVRLDRSTVAIGGGLVLLTAMTFTYLLGRRSDRRRASEAFGKQVDRRPRI